MDHDRSQPALFATTHWSVVLEAGQSGSMGAQDALEVFCQRETAQKRGGGHRPLSLESLSAEERYAAEPVSDETASARYDRALAETIVGETWRRLAAEQTASPARFAALRPLVLQPVDAATCRSAAQQLGLSEGAVKVAVHRLRQRFAEILRATVSEVTSDPGTVDQEIDYLIRILGA